MTSLSPPLLATWMLRRLIDGPHSEALEGDLLEAWRGGRSGAWYWRQVLIAVSPVRYSFVNPWIRLAGTVAALALLALGELLLLTLGVLLAVRGHRWGALVGTSVSLLAGFLLLAFALNRRHSSS